MSADRLIEFWKDAPQRAPFVHPADAVALRRLGIDLQQHGVHPALFPQPWVGPLRTARAFILQLNPGYSGPEVDIESTDQLFSTSLRENLSGQLPNLFLDPRFKSHPGRAWVESHLRGVASMEDLASEVAQLELFPYHSKAFNLPARI